LLGIIDFVLQTELGWRSRWSGAGRPGFRSEDRWFRLSANHDTTLFERCRL
jgi:hypothetical protein